MTSNTAKVRTGQGKQYGRRGAENYTGSHNTPITQETHEGSIDLIPVATEYGSDWSENSGGEETLQISTDA